MLALRWNCAIFNISFGSLYFPLTTSSSLSPLQSVSLTSHKSTVYLINILWERSLGTGLLLMNSICFLLTSASSKHIINNDLTELYFCLLAMPPLYKLFTLLIQFVWLFSKIWISCFAILGRTIFVNLAHFIIASLNTKTEALSFKTAMRLHKLVSYSWQWLDAAFLQHLMS